MSSEIFLRLKDTGGSVVKGEVIKDEYADLIQVSSVRWGWANASARDVSGGHGSGLASIGDIVIQKPLDRSSAKLQTYVINSDVLPSAELIWRQPGGVDENFEFYIIELGEINFTSFSTDSEGQGGRPTETYSIAPNKFVATYTQQQDTDGLAGEKHKVGWSITEAKTIGSI